MAQRIGVCALHAGGPDFIPVTWAWSPWALPGVMLWYTSTSSSWALRVWLRNKQINKSKTRILSLRRYITIRNARTNSNRVLWECRETGIQIWTQINAEYGFDQVILSGHSPTALIKQVLNLRSNYWPEPKSPYWDHPLRLSTTTISLNCTTTKSFIYLIFKI